MDFAFDESQREISELAAKILGDLVTHTRLKELEANGEFFDATVWAELAKANLLGLAVPEEYGGSGLGIIEMVLLLEQVGRHVAPVPVLHTQVGVGLTLAEFGSDALRKEWLPKIAAGDVIMSAALLEPHGDDPGAPSTTATRDGDGWILSGTKGYVPFADRAARILVPARTGEGAIGVFLVDVKASGVDVVAERATNGEPQARVDLREVRVAGNDVVGDPSAGDAVVRFAVDRLLVGQCALMLGVTEQALAMTAEYTKGRVQFDRPVATFQAVGQRAADAYIDVEAIRLTTWQAAWRLAEGLPATNEVLSAKFWAADGGQRVVHTAQHLHGGIGVDVDYPVHRYFVWAKTIELWLGGATRSLLRLGANLASEPV